MSSITESIEFTLKETKIIRSCKIEREQSKTLFSVIAEDMDKVNLIHVYEGILRNQRLNVDGIQIQLEGWNKHAHEAEERLRERLKDLKLGIITISKEEINKHEINRRIEEATEIVNNYPLNQNRLIVKTINDFWQAGLFYAALNCINKQ